jgi:hypothetical protein
MAPWSPGDPWPSGTPGGAAAPAWGGYVRLWLRAALQPGRAFHMGAHQDDRLDAGNVLGGGAAVTSGAGRAGTGSSLWIDLTCDTIDAEIQGGATGSQGIFSKADAATITVTLADPTGKYDPLNGHSPYAYGGHSRLVPGTPVEAFAEVVDGDAGTWERHYLFVGTADSWGEDWTPHPNERTCQLIATDITKQFVRMDRPEQAPVGAGDTVQQRIHRIVDFFGWEGTVVDPPGGSLVTLQATTLAQPAWELLNRATDDEIGYVHFDSDGALRWVNRQAWSVIADPVATFSCPYTHPVGHDVLTDASPSTLDTQMRNTVYASRSGGTMQTAQSESSVDRYGAYDYKRTDLGLNDDTQAGQWAEYVVVLYAYPQVSLADVTMQPSISDRSWEVWGEVLGLTMVTDLVRIIWAPPDRPDDVVDAASRVVGFSHRISRGQWELQWQLVAASALQFSGSVFTMGPHAQDRLDAGMVMGFTNLGGS